jgi:hypothetical protein
MASAGDFGGPGGFDCRRGMKGSAANDDAERHATAIESTSERTGNLQKVASLNERSAYALECTTATTRRFDDASTTKRNREEHEDHKESQMTSSQELRALCALRGD